jgi:hypothetical protein
MSSNRRSIALAVAWVMVGIAALAPSAFAHPGDHHTRRVRTGNDGAFAWLQPGRPAPGWTTVRLPDSPARLSAPPGWRAAKGDAGTATMVSRGASGRIVGYLNATPRQGRESVADWSRFRVAHNREEGDRDDRLMAAATGLGFRTGTGACVIDAYRTTTGNRFREIACIVAGRSATTVIVAAAPPSRWAAEAPPLERAISNFTT